MSIFSRDPDEQHEDDSRIPRKTIVGVVLACATIAAAIILVAGGLAWLAGRGRSRSLTQDRDIRPNTAVAAKIDLAAENDSLLQQPMWRVRPDWSVVPQLTPVKEGMLALGGGEGILFPATRSTFIISEPGPMSQVRTVWNLATLEELGAIPANIPANAPFALSPDGRHFAGMAGTSPPLVIDIYSARNGRKVKSLGANDFAGNVRILAFLDNEHVLAVLSQDTACAVYVWKMSSGVLHAPFTIAVPQTAGAIAISPDGRSLAVVSGKRLLIHECTIGKVAGWIDLSQQDKPHSLLCKGLAFSPDMTELAAYFEQDDISKIVSWKDGKKTAEHVLSRGELLRAATGASLSGPVLEWLPNREGWLVFGCLLIGRQQEAQIKTVPRSEREQTFLVTARVVGTDHLAVIDEREGLRSLRLIPIPHSDQSR